jgi:hypothetical protein
MTQRFEVHNIYTYIYIYIHTHTYVYMYTYTHEICVMQCLWDDAFSL